MIVSLEDRFGTNAAPDLSCERDAGLRLSDGRTICLRIQGAPDGRPVFLFHGLPGSRLQCCESDALGKQLGLRLCTMDRPGFGRSDPLPGRTYLDWADDAAAVADALEIDQFDLGAWSGGGPFALATARRHPERVRRLTLVSSLAPFENGISAQEMRSRNRLLLELARYAPWLLPAAVSVMAGLALWDVEAYLDRIMTQVCPSDRDACERDPQLRPMMLADLEESLRQGSAATRCEIALATGPWDFALEDVRVPVTLWHGEPDNVTPISMAHALAERLPRCDLTVFPEDGHFLVFKRWEAFLRTFAG